MGLLCGGMDFKRPKVGAGGQRGGDSQGAGVRPKAGSFEPRPKDSSDRTRDGWAVGGEGEGLHNRIKGEAASLDKTQIWEGGYTSSVLNVLILLTEVGEDRKSRA